MLITKKRIVLITGIGCILWSYYQLFAIRAEESFVGKQITALTASEEVKGEVINVKNKSVILSENKKIIEVPLHSVIKVGDLRVDEHETRRVLLAVNISISGGILIWIALFFL